MSKTTDLQIEKCRVLIDGLRKNIAEVSSRGISGGDLDAMEQGIADLAKASNECETMRAELSGKVKRMNDILRTLKDNYIGAKRKIKENYPQDAWMKYGVTDKR